MKDNEKNDPVANEKKQIVRSKDKLDNNGSRAPVSAHYDDDDFSGLDERFGGRVKNKYYAKVSAGYRNVKLVLIVLLVAIVLFALVLGADNFTYANLRYLLRNFGEATSNDTEIAPSVDFDVDSHISAGFFGGKLAVAGDEGFSLYRLSGKKIFDDKSEHLNARLACGDKYSIVWSYGERTVSVYNTVSLVHRETFDQPVYAVSVDDSGYYAVLMGDTVYSAAIRLFTPNFRLAVTVNVAERHVAGISLSPDGSRLSVISFTADNGEYVSTLEVFDTKNGLTLHSFKYPAEFAVKCGHFDNGGFFCLTGDRLYIYADDGSAVYSDAVPDGLVLASADGNNVCTVSNFGTSSYVNTVQVISSDGRLVCRFTCDSALADVCLTTDNVLVLGSSVLCVSIEDGGKTELPKKSGATALLSDGEKVYCIYPNRAELIFDGGNAVVDLNDNLS